MRMNLLFKPALSLAGAFISIFAAVAQSDFPNKPIKWVVGYSTGGPTDVIARIVSQDVSAALGQAIVIENRVGANGNIATESVAQAPADGYTLLVNTLSLNVNAILAQGRVKYDPVKDFHNHFSLPFKLTSRNFLDFSSRPSWLIRLLTHGVPTLANLKGLDKAATTQASSFTKLASTVGKNYDPAFNF